MSAAPRFDDDLDAATRRTLGPARSARAWSALLLRRRARLAALVAGCQSLVERELGACLRQSGAVDPAGVQVKLTRALRRVENALGSVPRQVGLKAPLAALDLSLDPQALARAICSALHPGWNRRARECAARLQTARIVALAAELASESRGRLVPGCNGLQTALEAVQKLGANPDRFWLAGLGLDAEAERRAADRFAVGCDARLAEMAFALAAQAVRSEIARRAYAWADAAIERPLRARIARLTRWCEKPATAA